MSSPKKPGTDLSALKAKLAKKGPEQAAPAAPAPAAAAPAAPAPAAKADIPAPGEKAAPPPKPDVPAPGKAAPAIDLPAPGEVRKAAPAPAPAAAAPAPAKPAGPAGAAFGGGASFDPNDGLIADVGGDLPSRGNKGIVVMAAVGALVFGIAIGWIGNNITSKGALVAVGKAKGADMLKEVQAVSDMRKSISLAMEEIPKKIEADPKAGAQAIKDLNAANFEKAPKVDNLFGWQLAAVHPVGIKKVFELYEEANGLRTDLAFLANFVDSYAAALKEGSGPRRFAVKFAKGGKALLVAVEGGVCGDSPCDLGDKGLTGLSIRETVNGEPASVGLGTDEGEAVLVDAEGQMYGYVIGLRPENYAASAYAGLFGRVKGRLEEMATAEKRALKALANYSENPDVDGSGQPEPGE